MGDDTAPTTSGLGFVSDASSQGVTKLTAPGPRSDKPHQLQPPYMGDWGAGAPGNYCERPIKVAAGNFTTGSTTVAYSEVLTPSALAVHVPNYQGALGFRATICYRVELAAAPQAQGLVKLAWQPLTSATTQFVTIRACSSSMHSADVNLAEASAAELRIPFLYHHDFWYLNGGGLNDPVGSMALIPYGPVAWDTTTVSTPSFTVFRWLEDAEPIGKTATPNIIVAQSAEQNYPRVSSWFKSVSDVATYASTIPSLTYIAAPLGWAFGAASKIAAHFGWSKPYEGSAMGYVHTGYGRMLNTCADADQLQPMGFYANNAVKVLPGFAGVDVDEMSICSITCRPGLIASFPLLATDTPDQLKWTCPVAPTCFGFQSAATGFAQQDSMSLGIDTTGNGPKQGYIPSPINFVASNFKYWRGDLIFRFRFVRTKFHAGRVLIGFLPSDSPWDGVTIGKANIAPLASARYDYHSIMVDLRTTSELDFKVPFVYNRAWCKVGMSSVLKAAHPVPSTGVVFMRIIDPLYGPDNVVSTVPVLVEVLSDCGLEFTQPITPAILPCQTNIALVAQSADLDFEACATCSGERILSLKQLAARPFWRDTGIIPNSVTYSAAQPNYAQTPVFGNVAGITYQVPVAISWTTVYTRLSFLSSIFALVRGSTVVRVIPGIGGTSFFSTAMWVDHDSANDTRGCAISIERNTGNCMQLPFYAQHNRVRTGWASGNYSGSDAVNGRDLILNREGTDTPYTVGVAAGDDYQLGAYMGIPPCVVMENIPATVSTLDFVFSKN